ncbi:acyltransferase family protein [Pseudomonas sp. SC11]|uniref:acyltransferase family protein n=1 Tax=Pseudomonas sp. SC11 TaxID=326927 RepID=UPI0039999DDD
MDTSVLSISANSSRSQNIDTLRLLLAVLVVVTHLAPWAFAVQGPSAIPESILLLTQWLEGVFQGNGETHPAVLGFIVLSGYCIHRNGLRSHRDGVAAYAIRRFFRIYPVFLLASLFGFGMFYIASRINPEAAPMVSGTHELTIESMLRKLLTTEAVNPGDYFPSIQGNGPLQTVAVEMWLYAVYPLALLIIGRLSDRAWWAVVAACWIASVGINTFIPEWRYWSYNASLIAFVPFWWIGLKFTDPNFARVMGRIVILPASAWLIVTVFQKDLGAYTQLFAGIRQVMFALCFGCLISFIDKARSTSGTALGVVGSAGYSIYAFHAPVVYVLVICGVPWWLIGLTAIAVGVAAFQFIEKPFMKIGRRLAAHHVGLRSA